MSYLYLASPYTHSNSSVREHRYLSALDALHWLLKGKIWTYSPIVHCHELARRKDLPKDHEFWQEYNHLMILQSRGVIVLQCEGWLESKGVADETLYAKRLSKPLYYMRKEHEKYAIFQTRDLSSDRPMRSYPGDDLRASELPDASEVT